MSIILLLLLFFGFILLSDGMTFIVNYYAQKNLLDIPNPRSSHQKIIPRGGGMAIVISFIFALFIFFFINLINHLNFYILLLSIIIAGVGFWDDHQSISAKWRLLVHLIVSIIAVFFLLKFPLLIITKTTIDFNLLGYTVIAIISLVWSLNLFNFMDGIDGLAASEAIFVATALAIFLYRDGFPLSLICITLSCSCLSFLRWNWPVARLFMGDVGSGFLGFVLGLLVLMAGQLSLQFLLIGVILLAVFLVDATYTLIYRFATGQKWYNAHCLHAYQQATKQYGHLKVLQVVWGINLFWLLPLAGVIYLFPTLHVIVVIIAYLPLIILTIKFNAGKVLI